MLKYKDKAFTLIEILISIFIMIILGSVGFLSYSNHLLSVRNTIRISYFSEIDTVLQDYKLKNRVFPIPNNSVNIVWSGSIIWKQGTFGKSVIDALNGNYNFTLDPLTKNEFTYSVTSDYKYYQLGGVFEDTGYLSSVVLSSANSIGKRKGLAYVIGTYNGINTTTIISGLYTILGLPSIISSDLSNNNLDSILTNKKLVYNNQTNLPESYKNTDFNVDSGIDLSTNQLVLFSGNLKELDDEYKRMVLMQSIKNSYSGTIMSLNDETLSYIVNEDISLITPNGNLKIKACDIIEKKIGYTTNCSNYDFRVFYFFDSIMSLSSIDFSGILGAKINGILKDNTISNLIWFGTNLGVSSYNTTTSAWVNFNSSNSTLPNGRYGVDFLGQTGNGKVLFGTHLGLFYCSSPCTNLSDWGSIPNIGFGVGQKEITSIDTGSGNSYAWVATTKGVAQLNSGTLVNMSTLNTDDTVVSMVENGSYLWVGTKNGLYRVLTSNLSSNTIYKETNIVTNEINSVFKDSSGSIWVLTKKGITKVTNLSSNPPTFDNSFNSSIPRDWKNVVSMFENPNGTYRFGTPNGIIKYDGSIWTTYFKDQTKLDIYPMIQESGFTIYWSNIMNSAVFSTY